MPGRRLILIHTFVLLASVALAGLGARWFFERQWVSHGSLSPAELERSLRLLDLGLVLFLLALALFLAWSSLILSRRLVLPIGRLRAKVQGVLNSSAPIEDLGEDSPGEWSELETSIEAIRKDLAAKVESIRTEREEQATLMGAISDAILAVDLDGSPLFYNTRFAVLLGPEEIKRRKHLWEMFREPEILGAFQSALREGRPTQAGAIPLMQDGGRKFFSVSASPLRKSNDAVYGAVGVFHDVTELKSAEQIRIDFVANVSHELRTPLTAIKGYADTLILDSDAGKPADPSFLQVIKRNTERLMALINDLLDLSSLESTDVLHKTRLETEEVTRRVLQQMQGGFARKQQQVDLSVSSAQVTADPKRLEQVLVNLLDNAHKYTPVGGHIQVTWERDAADSGAVVLSVKDTGPGIPPEHHPRLFERFYRVDKARSREQGGTGLGLAIVKHIMQRHDGAVWIESTPGRGSTFLCRFPG